MVKRYDAADDYAYVNGYAISYIEPNDEGGYVTHEDYVALQKERDALAAYVEQMHASIDKVWNADNDNRPKWWAELLQVMRHKPVTALAAHDAEVVRKAAYVSSEIRVVNGCDESICFEDQLLQYADSLDGK